ncbi:MAG: hypothetical protein CMH03_00245 [Marinovum sp.]|nr:hypothetical protein [Marinovum sp.]|tara:strand:+ start:434 stop:913 length:480 start_codon:yes stop_codon:yes gene_type:complete
MIFGYAKMIMVGVLVAGIAGAGVYVMKLQKDNAILKANQIKLEQSVESQKKVIEKQKADFGQILEANKKMNALVNNLQKDLADLDKRFTKGGRDFGKVALEKTKVIEKIINSGSDNVLRCVEISMGAPLTEEEKKATKKSQINRECPTIANPNYVPYNN